MEVEAGPGWQASSHARQAVVAQPQPRLQHRAPAGGAPQLNTSPSPPGSMYSLSSADSRSRGLRPRQSGRPRLALACSRAAAMRSWPQCSARCSADQPLSLSCMSGSAPASSSACTSPAWLRHTYRWQERGWRRKVGLTDARLQPPPQLPRFKARAAARTHSETQRVDASGAQPARRWAGFEDAGFETLPGGTRTGRGGGRQLPAGDPVAVARWAATSKLPSRGFTETTHLLTSAWTWGAARRDWTGASSWQCRTAASRLSAILEFVETALRPAPPPWLAGAHASG